MTTIEWTCNDDGTRGRTWNPVTGCDRISPGCDRCYAMREAPRLKAMGQPKYQRDGDPRTSGPGFGLTLHPQTLEHPLHWRRPTRIFVCSMADLFHARVPATYIEQVWDVMARGHWHTFQVLTKRAERMERVVTSMVADRDRLSLLHGDGPAPPLPNVWLGVSVESPPYHSRIRHLTRTPATVRFLSCEPLLAPLPDLPLDGIDWVIVGGESGPGARRMELDWVRDIRDRCRSAGVALFVKQMGSAWARGRTKGNDMDRWPPDLWIREMPHQGGGQRCVGW